MGDADTQGGPGRTLGGGSIVSRGQLIPRTPALQTSSMSLRGTPRGRENGVGSPVDADRFLGRMSPQTSLAPGPDLEGSRIVASSTPVRISVPLTEAPGRPTRWNRTDSIGGQAEMRARRKTKQKPAMVEPVEIPDAEHELVIERAAAIDVAKAAGKVCVRLPGKSGPRFSRVWDLPARSGPITHLAQPLVELGIEKVTVESTSDYWRIWYYLLEDQGLDVQLVNARDVKNVPGRPKTDKLDAVWLAKLTEKGLLRPSFVPPAPIRVLRDYTRLSEDLIRERTRYVQRRGNRLHDAAIKVAAGASKTATISTS